MEELQSHIVVAEKLPEDHSPQNLTKVFSAVGSVKTIPTCQPQTSNGEASAASRVTKMGNMLFSNKHMAAKSYAFVEYKTAEVAKKASKYVQARGRKAGHEGEGNYDDDDTSTSEQVNEKQLEDPRQPSDEPPHEHTGEEHVNDKEVGPRRGRGRGWGKARGWGQYSNMGTPNNLIQQEQITVATKQPPGPRMPDGTRGFTMGRGKPVV
ncbi:hypothetical protein HHK36_019916 [Tetracentron sinense]|uniref:RRM domain-containing protein n=1 Tax=Tetracentron sinense TaxID=13715 RepID=A0A835D7W1_TETSI|nr:hypothetical protein HHK36_019916 [Tetracentron sinense]